MVVRSPFAKKKEVTKEEPEPANTKSSTVGSKASASHRRVFTKSTQYFASITVKVLRATDLPAKKSIQAYCQLYMGR